MLTAIDIDAVAGKVDEQLIDARSIDHRLDGVEDHVGGDLLAAPIGEEDRLAAVAHALAKRPLVHALGAGRGIVQRLQLSGSIDADKHTGTSHALALSWIAGMPVGGAVVLHRVAFVNGDPAVAAVCVSRITLGHDAHGQANGCELNLPHARDGVVYSSLANAVHPPALAQL